MSLIIVMLFYGIRFLERKDFKNACLLGICAGFCGNLKISGIYVFATCYYNTAQDIAMAVFTSMTQGVLVAGLSTYVNQLIKQLEKDE